MGYPAKIDNTVLNLIDNYYEDKSKEVWEGVLNLGSSDLGGTCPRAVLYRIFKVPKMAMLAQYQRSGQAGTAFHKRMQLDASRVNQIYGFWKCNGCQKVLGKESKFGIVYSSLASLHNCSGLDAIRERQKYTREELFDYKEIKFEDKPRRFVSKIDGFYIKDNEYCIYEFKSVKDEEFKKIQENVQPDSDHVVQVHGMFMMTGIKRALLIYEGRNRNPQMGLEIERNEELITKVNLQIDLFNQFIKKNQVSPRPKHYQLKNPPCSFCVYRDTCWKEVS